MDIRLDEGFLFGMGAFETIAVEKGKPILLEKHLERLEQAADFFKLGSCSERGLSRERVLSYLAGQGSKFTDHGVLKIVCSAENLFFQMRTNTYSEEDYAKGFVADISKVRRNARLKSLVISSKVRPPFRYIRSLRLFLYQRFYEKQEHCDQKTIETCRLRNRLAK